MAEYDKKRLEYAQRIQEARERGDKFTEQQLQQELNYMDDAHLKSKPSVILETDKPLEQ